MPIEIRGNSQRSAASRMFSSTVVRELASRGRSGVFGRLVSDSGVLAMCGVDATVGDAFQRAFEMLKVGRLRDEYVYRAALTHRVLLGRHSLRTASMLTEFRAGASKADLVILNGTMAAYEIKSERDTLARLPSQVRDYRRVFASVNVITGERHITGVIANVPEDVGVMCLSERFQISTVRAAQDRPESICPTTVFESLRAAEAVSILKGLGVRVPDVPNTERHAALREAYRRLDPVLLHTELVRVLKQSRSLALLSSLVDELPDSLHAAALTVPIRRADQARLVRAVRTSLVEAAAWA